MSAASQTPPEPAWKHFRGMCDASALEMLDDDLFVAANDEDNVLRVYSRLREGPPVQEMDFTGFYKLRKSTLEIDLEAAARIGDRIYWISSHGANSKGKVQPSRHRFFATQIVTNNGALRLAPVGQLSASLLQYLVNEPSMVKYRLDRAAKLPPKHPGGLNIEGMAASPDGQLLIGLRNPIPSGKALVVALRNPAAVTRGERPLFGVPVSVDFNGHGIRSITPYADGYLVIAGPFDTEQNSHLYFWDGKSERGQLLSEKRLPGNPEGLAVVGKGSSQGLLVLSDDGSVKIGSKDCKKLKDSNQKVFRGYELPL